MESDSVNNLNNTDTQSHDFTEYSYVAEGNEPVMRCEDNRIEIRFDELKDCDFDWIIKTIRKHYACNL